MEFKYKIATFNHNIIKTFFFIGILIWAFTLPISEFSIKNGESELDTLISLCIVILVKCFIISSTTLFLMVINSALFTNTFKK